MNMVYLGWTVFLIKVRQPNGRSHFIGNKQVHGPHNNLIPHLDEGG